jgi:hypothetical protein
MSPKVFWINHYRSSRLQQYWSFVLQPKAVSFHFFKIIVHVLFANPSVIAKQNVEY